MNGIVRKILPVYLLLLFKFIATARQIGCISNVVFISTDTTIQHANFTIDDCACQLRFEHYSGFNYYGSNHTCMLFVNFTQDFELLVQIQGRFCFIDKLPDSTPRSTANVQTTDVLATASPPVTTMGSTQMISTTETTECATFSTTASGCIIYLALRLPTDICNLIVFAQTANPWNAVGFAQEVTKLVGSSPTNPTDGCFTGVPYIGGNATGKIALVRRGTCLFHTKCINAQNAGALAVIIYNNVAGAVSPTFTGTPPVTIPVVVISAADGAKISAAIDASSSPLPILTVLNVTYNC